MKPTLLTTLFFACLFVSCLFVFCSCGKKISKSQLQLRNGVAYEVNSEVPFTGRVMTDEYGSISNYKNGLLDGKYTRCWTSGNLQVEAYYEKGLLNGELISYGSKEVVNCEEHYIKGRLEGKATYAYNGKIERESNYKNGLLEGLQVAYYDNGQKKCEVNFHNGRAHGKVKIWFSNGEMMTEFSIDPSFDLTKVKLYTKGGLMDEIIQELPVINASWRDFYIVSDECVPIQVAMERSGSLFKEIISKSPELLDQSQIHTRLMASYHFIKFDLGFDKLFSPVNFELLNNSPYRIIYNLEDYESELKADKIYKILADSSFTRMGDTTFVKEDPVYKKITVNKAIYRNPYGYIIGIDTFNYPPYDWGSGLHGMTTIQLAFLSSFENRDSALLKR